MAGRRHDPPHLTMEREYGNMSEYKQCSYSLRKEIKQVKCRYRDKVELQFNGSNKRRIWQERNHGFILGKGGPASKEVTQPEKPLTTQLQVLDDDDDPNWTKIPKWKRPDNGPTRDQTKRPPQNQNSDASKHEPPIPLYPPRNHLPLPVHYFL